MSKSTSQELKGNLPTGPWVIDGFRISLTCDDICILIKAESLKSSNFYSATLNTENIGTIFRGTFEALTEVYEYLLETFEKTNPRLESSISEQGEITLYEKGVKIGGKLRDLEYKIQLEKEELDRLETCERLLSALSSVKGEKLNPFEEQLSKVFGNLILHCSAMKAELNEIKAQVDLLGKSN